MRGFERIPSRTDVEIKLSNNALFFLQDECLAALTTISNKINGNDADMRQHVVLSMFKVAAAEADVPPLPSSAAAVAFGFNSGPSDRGGGTGSLLR